MGKLEYTKARVTVCAMGKAAALLEFETDQKCWIPYALMSTDSAALLQDGETFDARIETWKLEQEEIEV